MIEEIKAQLASTEKELEVVNINMHRCQAVIGTLKMLLSLAEAKSQNQIVDPPATRDMMKRAGSIIAAAASRDGGEALPADVVGMLPSETAA